MSLIMSWDVIYASKTDYFHSINTLKIFKSNYIQLLWIDKLKDSFKKL